MSRRCDGVDVGGEGGGGGGEGGGLGGLGDGGGGGGGGGHPLVVHNREAACCRLRRTSEVRGGATGDADGSDSDGRVERGALCLTVTTWCLTMQCGETIVPTTRVFTNSIRQFKRNF